MAAFLGPFRRHNPQELRAAAPEKYLLTYLTGSSKPAIEGIRLAEQTYDLVIKMLALDAGIPL
ncbi:hypothetical protein HPB52_010049 [Rhipicephalus sanguineus]|uniref:Uncharacterized protein n=1 Tax=Rhipicephalus sanguineus TaxID=34632 RepID=A0A9D4PMP6_RHISA|nr:hypothetical protein HPB52_010049 [Rhipicephalus sanguineus]